MTWLAKHVIRLQSAQVLCIPTGFEQQSVGFLEVLHERLLDAVHRHVAAIALRKLQAFNGQNIINTVSLPA